VTTKEQRAEWKRMVDGLHDATFFGYNDAAQQLLPIIPALLDDVERLATLLGKWNLKSMCICNLTDGDDCLACDCMTELRRLGFEVRP
jgi:hypothetical protein